jgi:hypothetical protein
MSREGSMSLLWGAVGCAALLALVEGHGLAQSNSGQNAAFNSYQVNDGWLKVPAGRRMGLATKVALTGDRTVERLPRRINRCGRGSTRARTRAFAKLLLVPFKHGEREVHSPKAGVFIDGKRFAEIRIRIGLIGDPHLFEGIPDLTPDAFAGGGP